MPKPIAWSAEYCAKLRLMKALDYVVLRWLSGQTLAVPKLLLFEEHDFVSFIRDYVQRYYITEKHERVSYFAIGITLDGFLQRRLASVNGYFVSVARGLEW